MDLKALQNGSDIRGIAMEGVSGEEVNLTAEAAARIARAFLSLLSESCGKNPSEMKIAIGRDSRLSGEALLSVFAAALSEAGCGKVLDCGLASTPAMFMSTVFHETACDGAVMVTASHLPWNRNGFKFFRGSGGFEKEDVSNIIRRAEADPGLSSAGLSVEAAEKKIEKFDLMALYSAELRRQIVEGAGAGDAPLSGLKIAVDAGNGAGGFYAEAVLAPLGADISASRFLEPDGRFPNHAPNPENKAAMAALSEAVREGGADLGLIFDTDVDRSAAVGPSGNEIARNRIVALAAALIGENGGERPTVVTDSVTSDELSAFLEAPKEDGGLGMEHFRFKRGYRNVINKALELNEGGVNCPLAIETSGHAAYRENYFLDDGAYLATKIVIKTALLKREGRDIESLISALSEPEEAFEYRLPIKSESLPGGDFRAYGESLLGELASWVRRQKNSAGLELKLAEPNYEGVRISFKTPDSSGWALLRLSLHEPLLPLNVECNKKGGSALMLNRLSEFLSSFEALDLSPLR